MLADEYIENLSHALMVYKGRNGYGIYEGIDGCKRLARELGYGLKDYSEKERNDVLQNSYSVICVRFYGLKPPISAKEWVKEIMKTWGENE